MVNMFKFLFIFVLIPFIRGSIDSDLQIDGLFPPDIDHDWRFNWNAFPSRFPKKFLQQQGELLSLDSSTKTNKIEPERKTFMDFASMLPIPNAEALMAASGVSLLQNVASASVPNIPKMVSTFFNIRDMFNNRQPLSLLRSRSYQVKPGKGEREMVFGKREIRPRQVRGRRRNVTRKFKRPIVVAPLENMIESEVKVEVLNKTTEMKPVQTEVSSMERHTFVNSDFVGIPSPKEYYAHPQILENRESAPKSKPNNGKDEKLSSKLPVKGRFILKNPLETTVRASYENNLFKSAPVMEDKFFTTSLRDLFQSPSNKADEKQNKIVIITDDDLNDSKRTRMGRQRSRSHKSQRPPQPLALESRKPPAELPVYIQEQRQMTGMHPPPIQIPNIFEEAENEIKTGATKNEYKEVETKIICEHQSQRKPKKMPVKPTKNPVHSSVMDIITNHSPSEAMVTPHPQIVKNNNNYWGYSSPAPPPPLPPQSSYMDVMNVVSERPIASHVTLKNSNWSHGSPPQRTPKKVSQKHPAQKVRTTAETPQSYVNLEQEFNPWNTPNNEQWAPNVPAFKQLPQQQVQQSYSEMDMNLGVANPAQYYTSNNDNNYDEDENEEQEDDDMMDEMMMEYPSESKKVVRLMMPEVKFPPKQQQQFPQQLQYQKKPLTTPGLSQYSAFSGSNSNIEQQRYPSPHMMLNDGLLFQRYNLLKEIEQMQSSLFGGNVDDSETLMSNQMLQSQMMPSQMMSSQMMSNPMMASPLISAPAPVMQPQTGPVVFGNSPSGPPTSVKSAPFMQKGKPMKLMKFRL